MDAIWILRSVFLVDCCIIYGQGIHWTYHLRYHSRMRAQVPPFCLLRLCAFTLLCLRGTTHKVSLTGTEILITNKVALKWNSLLGFCCCYLYNFLALSWELMPRLCVWTGHGVTELMYMAKLHKWKWQWCGQTRVWVGHSKAWLLESE